jgi:hypothetical protein
MPLLAIVAFNSLFQRMNFSWLLWLIFYALAFRDISCKLHGLELTGSTRGKEIEKSGGGKLKHHEASRAAKCCEGRMNSSTSKAGGGNQLY